MRLSPALLLFPALLAAPVWAQSDNASQPAPQPTASAALSPALDKLRTAVGNLRLDKWKAPAQVREEARTNVGSLGRDLDGTLPGLLAAADAAPGAVSENLPVFRNVDALYDVLLRVVQTADLAAPTADSDALHGALAALEDARRSLGDQIQAAAVASEAQTKQLQAQAAQQPAAKPTPTTVVDNTDAKPAPTPRKKRKPAPPQ